MILPISQKEQEIKASILKNDITIVLTPTSSGKTMLTPKYVHDLFGGCVYCTVPRVPIAKRSAASANKVVWDKTKYSAGFITGKGTHRPQNAAVIYATEGSVLNMIANGFNPHVLMLDEAHEQGVFMEALLRKAKDIVKAGGKVIITSATIDADRYKKYYQKDGMSVDIIELPKSQRAFTLTFKDLGESSPAKAIADEANNGKRCLVGLSGKREIDNFITALKNNGCKTPIFPFHSELEEEEIDAIDKCNGAMVIVSTNILQSGVTLPQVSVGYFEGEGKQMIKQGNSSKLVTYDLSKSEMEQWYGRLGRTCEGTIYVNQLLEVSRLEMPIPEIKRVSLEDACLQLTNVGIDIFNADLLNQPEETAIYEAAENLELFGLIRGSQITDLGRKVLFSGMGIRAGIVTVLGNESGIANTAEKVAAIMNIGSPFRRAIFRKDWYNKESKQCDLLVWKDTIETLADQFCYDGKIEPHKAEAFIELCENNGIFRRNMKKLFRRFAEIDKIFVDTNTAVVPTFVDCFFRAFPDCVDKDWNISDARESIACGEGNRTGSILNIGRAVFFEYVCYEMKE